MVQWKKLEDIASPQRIRNKNHITENAYSITQNGLIPTKDFFKEKTNITSSNTSGYLIVEKDWFVYSPSRIDVGSINYLKDEGPVIVSPIDVVFSIDKEICLPSYLLNYFFTYRGKKDLLKNREGVEGTGRRSLPFEAIKTMRIPIPSLEEQSQIVGILNSFTNSINNLKAEIDNRKKQYAYLIDNVFGSSLAEMRLKAEEENIPIESLSAHGKFTRGRRFVRTDVVEEGQPCIHYGDMYTYYGLCADKANTHLPYDFPKKMRYAKKGDVVIVGAGENNEDIAVGLVWLGDEPAAVHDACYIYESDFEPMFLSYFLRSGIYHLQIKSHVVRGKICSISSDGIGKALIPIYPIEKQKKIVEKLLPFEKLIANMQEQLELRQKQYEYYRNKLLTFE